MSDHSFREIEKKIQQRWLKEQTFRVDNHSDKPKYYVLDMFPYPSGAGLHVGHPLGYIASDIVARFKRLKGFNVLHPMGFDAFGLPAEQYAIQTGQHPAVTTEDNTARYREQMQALGFSFDWSREFKTSQPDYYRWTQWIFQRFFEYWYDKALDKARPISELVSAFEQNGTAGLNPAVFDENVIEFKADFWNSLSESEKQRRLMYYRLAFLAHVTVNWCPGLGTVLANDEVKDGVSERGGFPVERKQMNQWCLRITAYADRLLEGLDALDWSDAVKEMQRNWIGKSRGASIIFLTEVNNVAIEVFTTRPDTIYGVTFICIAPEHRLVQYLTTEDHLEEVTSYVESVKNRSERDRMSEVKRISGAFTGSWAINPLDDKHRIPIWVADYVLAGYGTGAVMAVPSSDIRDYAFAKHFGMRITTVLEGSNTDISVEGFDPKAGTMINSGDLNGLTVPKAIDAAITIIETEGFGKGRIIYRLRDALFSRQRYWGEPIPIYYKDNLPHLLPDSELPLILPEIDAYKPTETGEPPLARALDWFYNTETAVAGGTTDNFPLETNTMPGWAGSSWYFLRYMDPANADAPFSAEAAKYWNQVDLYLGGSEHATGHLLYARFWTMFLYDMGLLNFSEPFKRLVNQGMIQGVSEKTTLRLRKMVNIDNLEVNKFQFLSADLPASEFEHSDNVTLIDVSADITMVKDGELDLEAFVAWRPEYADAVFITAGGFIKNGVFSPDPGKENPSSKFLTRQEVEKMSKSKYNVVNPDDVIADYSADTLRVYEMFLGPLEQSKPWSTHGIEGTWKFLRKYRRLFFDDKDNFKVSEAEPTADELRVLHKAIRKVEDDIERLSLNTAVSTFMICVNELQSLRCNKRAVLEPLTILLSPYAPHLTEEIWALLGYSDSIAFAQWPVWNEEFVKDNTFECPVSINGKVRVKLTFPLNTTAAQIETETLANDAVQKFLEGRTPKKIVVVPNRIINLVM
ncbi:MAG: class I tRNA ligase family protein [Bacteroidota bacterium]